MSVGFCYTATGDTWYHNPDAWYYSASMYKVPVMMILAERYKAGEITDETRISGLTLAEANELILVYSHNDSMILGVLDILEQQGIRPGKDIVLITVDGEKEAVDALKAGRINCVVQCTPKLGPAVMELVSKLKAGEEIQKVTHPEEGAWTDFDDLTDPATEGF